MKMTGYSRQQVTRLIGQPKRKGRIEWQPCGDNGFSRRYSNILFPTEEFRMKEGVAEIPLPA
jgi:hypothetical protein